MTPRPTLVATALGLAIAAAIAACGAGSAKTSVSSPPPQAIERDPLVLPATPREQIEQLEADTNANLARLGVDRPAPFFAGSAEDARPLSAVRDVCETPPHRGETCGTVCGLADHVCTNSTQICDLAAELAPDAWAAAKCQDGKSACEAARRRCCSCQ